VLPFGLGMTGQGEPPDDPELLEPAELFEDPELRAELLDEDPELRAELLDDAELPKLSELLVDPELPARSPAPSIVGVPPQDMVTVAATEMTDAMIVRTRMARIPAVNFALGYANQGPPRRRGFRKGHCSTTPGTATRPPGLGTWLHMDERRGGSHGS
jgi:hypothetical protein